MQIAYVCVDPGIPVFGTKGASVHVQEVIRQLRALGHEVKVYAVRVGHDVPADLADLDVERFAIKVKDPAAREEAQKQASRDIVAAIDKDGADFIYERYSLFSTVIADADLPAILEVNAPLIEEQATHRVLVDPEYPHEALCRQVESAAATICVSEHVKAWVDAHVAGGNVHVLANGVNVERIMPQPEQDGVPVVTFVGTLKPWHGTHDLLAAKALAATEWQLRIIGDGPEREPLEKQAAAYGIEVDFRGAIAPADMPQHLAGSAVGVAPYPKPEREEDHYFSPLKVYEYLAAGLPVVATNVGQVPAGLAECGILVGGSDPAELAAAIDTFVANRPLRQRAGTRARALAVESHSWASVVHRSLELAGITVPAQVSGRA